MVRAMSDLASLVAQLSNSNQLPASDPAMAAVKLARASLDALVLKLGQTIDAKVVAQLAAGLTQLSAGGESFVLKLETPLPNGTAVTIRVAPTPQGTPAVTISVPAPIPAAAPLPLPTPTGPLMQAQQPALPQATQLPLARPATQPAAAPVPQPQPAVATPVPQLTVAAQPQVNAQPLPTPPSTPAAAAPVPTLAPAISIPALPAATAPTPVLPPVSTPVPAPAVAASPLPTPGQPPAQAPLPVATTPQAPASAPAPTPLTPTPPVTATATVPTAAPAPLATAPPSPAPAASPAPPAPILATPPTSQPQQTVPTQPSPYPVHAPQAATPVAAPQLPLSAPTPAATPKPVAPPLNLADSAQAAARQDSAAPLLARLAAIVTAAAPSVPRPVLEAAQKVLVNRIDLNRAPPDGRSLEAAVLRAGVVLTPAGRAAPADSKSALLALRSSLLAFLGSDATAPVEPVARPAPPIKGEPPRAPLPQASVPEPPAEGRETARTLLGQTDAALSRLKLLQSASQPPVEAARIDAPVPRNELRVEIPMLLGTQTGILQLMVERDGKHKREPDRQRGWRMRFAMNFSETGEVGADIALLGRSASVAIWAADPDTADAIDEMLPELAPAIQSHGLELTSLRVRRGTPRQAAAPGQLLDSAR